MIIGIDASRAFAKEPTGTEQYSTNLINAMLRIPTRHEFVLYLRGDRIEKDSSLHKLSLPNTRLHLVSWPLIWTQGGLAWETWIAPPDVLFIPAHTLPVIGNPRVRTVVTVHDLGVEWLPQYHQFPQKHYMMWSTDFAIRHATRVIAVSEATRKDIIKRYKRRSKGIYVVHEGVDHTLFRPVSRRQYEPILARYGISQPYFLFVGTIQPRKNLVRLIEAYSMLLKRPGLAGMSLVLAGKPGWLNEDIYAAPRKLGIEHRVQFLGHVEPTDLPALYSGAAALVFPSLFEGFGLPILEAFACGCPVITSNVSSMPEVAGNAALLVNPLSTEEIAGAMTRVVEANTRAMLTEWGKKRAAVFTWERAAKQTLAVLEEAGSEKV